MSSSISQNVLFTATDLSGFNAYTWAQYGSDQNPLTLMSLVSTNGKSYFLSNTSNNSLGTPLKSGKSSIYPSQLTGFKWNQNILQIVLHFGSDETGILNFPFNFQSKDHLFGVDLPTGYISTFAVLSDGTIDISTTVPPGPTSKNIDKGFVDNPSSTNSSNKGIFIISGIICFICCLIFLFVLWLWKRRQSNKGTV